MFQEHGIDSSLQSQQPILISLIIQRINVFHFIDSSLPSVKTFLKQELFTVPAHKFLSCYNRKLVFDMKRMFLWMITSNTPTLSKYVQHFKQFSEEKQYSVKMFLVSSFFSITLQMLLVLLSKKTVHFFLSSCCHHHRCHYY